MSKISIIVPFYNCPYINHALESLVNQTYQNIEIIVINDGSTKYSEKIVPYLDKIKYIEKENGGTASALNMGIQHATGDYICWLSSDDIFYLEKTAVQLAFMKEKKALFSYTNYYCINEKGKVFTDSLGIHVPNQLSLLRTMIRGNIINGCSVMIHKSVFDKVGVFDESLPYTHDYDLWLRIIQEFDIHYVSQPLLLYRVHDQMGTKKHAPAIKKEIKKVVNRHRAQIKKMLLEKVKKK
ncbi:glycosyltransferase [Priestia megaterium]|nr:glycosyltransferase [Priestia megaterium]